MVALPLIHDWKVARSPEQDALQASTCADWTFGGRLYRHRQSRGLSQAALAKCAAISSGYLSELENSKRKPPKQRIVRQLALALGLNAQEQHLLLCLAVTERALTASDAIPPKLASLLQALHIAAPALPEQTIDTLINALKEAEM